MFIRWNEGWDTSKSAASDKWYYCYIPNGIASGATSLLILLFAKDLGASVGQVGIIAAASSLSSIPAFMLWGHLSDRTKKRKIFVLLGFLGMALCLFLMGMSGGVQDYFLSNLLFGFLVAASAPVATALVIETAARDQWARRIAAFSKIGGIGWVAGLILGAVWLEIDFNGLTLGGEMRALFIIGAALALLSALVAWRWIEEPEERLGIRPLHPPEHHFITIERLRYLPMRMLHRFEFKDRSKRQHRFTRSLNVYLSCVFLLFAGFTAFYAFFPIFLVDEIGMQSSAIFVVYIASQATSVAFYSRVGKWVQDKGSKKMQILGSGARTILFPSFLGIALFHLDPVITLVAILVLHSLVGLCWALINVSGSMIISNLASPDVRAEAFGAYNAMQGVGSVAGPVAGGLICEFFGYPAGFISASVFILLGILVLIRLKVDAR